jgi:hypothetical protein
MKRETFERLMFTMQGALLEEEVIGSQWVSFYLWYALDRH